MRDLPKLCAPDTQALFTRPRLHALLDDAAAATLTWVSSPAGAGKTCLLAGYVKERSPRAVWLSLDEGDAEPATFFHYLSRALSPLLHGARLPVLVPEARADPAAFSRGYLRAVRAALPDGAVIVLDNAEVLDDEGVVLGGLASALDELRGLRLFIAGRRAVPASFARARATGALVHVDFDHVRFDDAESHLLLTRRLAARGGALSDVDAARLCEWTQGWAAGLVLGLEQLHLLNDETVRTASTPFAVFDFFAAEVLRDLDPAVRAVLLRTAFLPEVSAAHAQRLTDDKNAPRALEELARRGTFTFRLAGGPKRYRYHPLFRRFLCAEAERTCSAAELRALRVDSARVLLDDGAVAEAAALFREAEDFPALAALVCAHAEAFIQQGRLELVMAWTADVPTDTPSGIDAQTYAWVRYWRGAATLPLDRESAQALFIEAFSLFERLPDGDVDGVRLAWCGAVEAILFGWRNFRALDAWIDEGERLSAQSRSGSLRVEGRFAAIMYNAMLFRRCGDEAIHRWAKPVRRMLFLVRVLDPSSYVLLVNSVFHDDLWAGRVGEARALLDSVDGMVNAERVGPVAKLAWYTMRAVFSHMVGDGKTSVEVAEAGLRYASDTGVHLWDALLQAAAVLGANLEGDRERVTLYLGALRDKLLPDQHLENTLYHDAAVQAALSVDDRAGALHHSALSVRFAEALGALWPEALIRLARAQALFAAGEREAARHELSRVEQTGEQTNSDLLRVRCGLARAEDALDRGDDDEARALLARALGLARTRGYDFFPVWRAQAMSRLCAFALAHGIERDTVVRLVRRRALPPPHQAGDAGDLRAWPWPVQVFALGQAFTVKVDGAVLSFRGKSQKRPLELLQALVAQGGVDVREEHLAEALWPDAEGDAAAQAMSTTLHRLRRLLGNDAIVRADGRLSLDPARVWVDALEGERRWSALDAADHAAVLASLALYQAPLLAGVTAPWVFAGRERLTRKYVRAVLWAARALASDGDAEPALVVLEAALDKEPDAESLHAELVSLLRRERRDAEAGDAERRWQRARAADATAGAGLGDSMR